MLRGTRARFMPSGAADGRVADYPMYYGERRHRPLHLVLPTV